MGTQLSKIQIQLRARVDSEHEQAILRIVIVALVLLYMAATYRAGGASDGHGEFVLVQGLAAALTFAVGIFVAICISPAPSRTRRVVGMVADAGAATFCMYLAGESGVSMLGVYLFITFGNGFRYGRSYLFACQLLCLVGFTFVLVESPYWERHQVAGWSLMTALIILPVYVSTLLKRIQEARNKAEEASRAKSSFLANMSHEMRTPLNGIVGVAELLQTTPLSAEQSELMRLLRHSVALLRSLVDDVLDISKIEAGRLSIERVDFDLHAMLNGLVKLLKPHASEKGLAFRAMVDPAIDYSVRGDPHHLRQVLVNLLSNAIKFTAQGEVELSCSLVSTSAEGTLVRFAVRDTGIGISEDAQRRIFEQFVQADDSTTRRYGGTGLGTTIAKQLVELMGGTIGVQSSQGVGSTFWFEIPLLGADEPTSATALTQADSYVGDDTAILIDHAGVNERLHAWVDRACSRVETVPAQRAVAAIKDIARTGRNIVAVVVDRNYELALSLFKEINGALREKNMALVFVGDVPSNSVGRALKNIEGVTCLSENAELRLFTNAIHAATIREARVGAEVIDLGMVLKEQRQPLRVLVAEDNPTNQTIIRQLLESAGHSVLLASDGEEALDLFEDENPDIALLDFNMPERNGIEVVTAIRTMESINVRLPIIILSASVTLEAREMARDAGADEFVGKPFDAATLLQVIDRVSRRVQKGSKPPSMLTTASPLVFGALPLIDQARVGEVERIATSPEFVRQLLLGFEDDAEKILRHVDLARARGDSKEIADLAHALRGAALGVGAAQLAARAQAIESAAAANRSDEVAQLLGEVRKCFDLTINAFEELQSVPNLSFRLTRSRSLQ